MRAAESALPFERPKLSMNANAQFDGFASGMEELSRRMRAGGNVIDAKANLQQVEQVKDND
jgi:hypothetical protein